MRLSRKVWNALTRQGISSKAIKAALEATRPAPLRMSRAMSKRIMSVIGHSGVAVVTRKHVHTMASYLARQKNGKNLAKRGDRWGKKK